MQRFEMAGDILESHIGGPLIFTKFVMIMEGYDSDDIDKTNKLIQTAFEQYYANVHLNYLVQIK
jgi:hypothetical protein